nr:hypothetical protein CFP56_71060 [Quercus suber]
MSILSETDQTRLSSAAAESFVDSYYTALNGARNTIKNFYVATIPGANGRGLPHISYNGELIQDASEFQERFDKQMPWTHFEPQSFNVMVMNPSINALPEDKLNDRRAAERNMSLLVQVSGYVRLEERKDGPMRGFSESIVLVPTTEESAGKGTGKMDHGRKWLIQSQNFRFVV